MSGKIKNFIEEFKAFALRGNMMDMAVGIIIGGAFTGIVTSLTDNFINPILNFVTGAETYTLQNVAGFASSFVSELVNFFIMAFVLFLLLKGMNKLVALGKKPEAQQRQPPRFAHSARARFLSQPPAAHTAPPSLRKQKSRKPSLLLNNFSRSCAHVSNAMRGRFFVVAFIAAVIYTAVCLAKK